MGACFNLYYSNVPVSALNMSLFHVKLCKANIVYPAKGYEHLSVKLSIHVLDLGDLY